MLLRLYMERTRLGRYELISHLATGGMGRVVLARSQGESGFERHVVIKVLEAVEIDDTTATDMFLDEARLLGMLHHQHIAAILEVGRADDGRLFLVLEYVHGHNAHDVWQRARELTYQLPLDFALAVVSAAASGLHHVHTKRSPDGDRLKLVHRDVTLSNLMIGFDGAIKIIDFGIAKAAVRSTKTQTGLVKGKLGYMAPEQLQGKADARTDVFALGVVLYELTTMQRAFREASDRGTVERVKTGNYLPPSQIVPDYPAELEAIVGRALSVDPGDRFQTADEMRRSVESLGHRLHLLLGDAPVMHVMSELFSDHSVPWQRRASTRTESAIEVEWDPHSAPTRVAPNAALDALTPPPRAITEGADHLVIEIEDSTVTHGTALDEPAPSHVVPEHSATASSVDALIAELAHEPAAAPPSPAPPVPTKSLPVLRLTPKRPEAPRKRRYLRWWLVGGAAAVAVSVPVGIVAMREPSAAVTAEHTPRLPEKIERPAPAPPDAAPLPAGPTMVRVRVTSTPSDATVLVDGRRLGRTPFDGEVELAPGPHTLKLRRRGYVAEIRTFDLAIGAVVDETFELDRSPSP
ncbi:MAG TPA: serine/threonine-protein kinase [Kofleriaceae bacterium]